MGANLASYSPAACAITFAAIASGSSDSSFSTHALTGAAMKKSASSRRSRPSRSHCSSTLSGGTSSRTTPASTSERMAAIVWEMSADSSSSLRCA